MELDAEVDGRGASPVEELIAENFKCSKCSGLDCSVQEVAMTGTGFSKLLDIQHHHYLFVSCEHCGFVEVYNPDVLRNKKSGALGTIMDTLFG
ncbi:zinc ribbon domain-containing protein [Paenibacillus mendelii]|uniref:Zinc ribbon domain-containing protein n=1 Tax=Paenibacillus mendelii TaxID=206163 RepID=A0ABV6JB13_9BACL|nr:zinc ribbon domain-containing protein [Paenibacillus mendelii]MCQ6562967.1 zinc ribbon domain-containing protein [Paenibacillus mendelii]